MSWRGAFVLKLSVAFPTRSQDNKNIYDEIGCAITENVFQGRNGTLFAYGQTSAGPTALPCVPIPPEPGRMRPRGNLCAPSVSRTHACTHVLTHVRTQACM